MAEACVALTVAADDAGVRAATDLARRFAAANRLDETARGHLLLIVEEMLTNLVKYGYAADTPRGSARIALKLDAGTLSIEIDDEGQAFDPTTAPAPNLDLPIEKRPIGGLGLHLVRSVAQELRYVRIDGRNRTTLRLLLGTAPQE